MKAQVGDRLAPDGDTDRIALVSPGPYARILPADPVEPADDAAELDVTPA